MVPPVLTVPDGLADEAYHAHGEYHAEPWLRTVSAEKTEGGFSDGLDSDSDTTFVTTSAEEERGGSETADWSAG